MKNQWNRINHKPTNYEVFSVQTSVHYFPNLLLRHVQSAWMTKYMCAPHPMFVTAFDVCVFSSCGFDTGRSGNHELLFEPGPCEMKLQVSHHLGQCKIPGIVFSLFFSILPFDIGNSTSLQFRLSLHFTHGVTKSVPMAFLQD